MSRFLDVAHAVRPLPGCERAGDLCVVQRDGASVRAAIIDGIGHGDLAADAAQTIADAIQALPPDTPLAELFAAAHGAARRTRGAVMSALVADAERGEVVWAGVGNVEGVLHSGARRERLSGVGGIVGERMPRVQVRTLPLAVGDVLLVCTDGAVGAAYDSSVTAFATVARSDAVAAHFLALHASAEDDALVFVAQPREVVTQPRDAGGA